MILNSGEMIVPFLGAGVSMLPPSSLPGWTEFNDIVLEALCRRVADFSQNSQPTDLILNELRNRRDQTKYFSPDYQAQLMEDECGEAYFKVWQSLDTDTYNSTHAALAELAAQGKVAAIVTTNFDRLLEVTLAAREVAFSVHSSEADFARLAEQFERGPAAGLAVIKIHGTIEQPSSMVDTLRQRVAGRPPTLTAVLAKLLAQHHWLFIGFSGADLDYDPNYLGIRDAASSARGFTFLTQSKTKLRSGVTELVETFGSGKATVEEGNLPDWLFDGSGFAIPPAGSPRISRSREEALAVVRSGVGEWLQHVGNISAINILYSMLQSCGREYHAFRLLRKTWKWYRNASDMKSVAYWRYNYNMGKMLLDAGHLHNPIDLADDASNASEWREYANLNAFEYLARAYTGEGQFMSDEELQKSPVLSAGADLALVMTLRGEGKRGLSTVSKVFLFAKERHDNIAICDAAICAGQICDMLGHYSAGVAFARSGIAAAASLGDEPRRARLNVCLARLLVYKQEFEEAEKLLRGADAICERLGLEWVKLQVASVKGLLRSERGDYPGAVESLQRTASQLATIGEQSLYSRVRVDRLDASRSGAFDRQDVQTMVGGAGAPLLCRVWLDLVHPAFQCGDTDLLEHLRVGLYRLTSEKLRGYFPHVHLAMAQCVLLSSDPNRQQEARDRLIDAKEVGEDQENEWVVQEADRLLEYC